MNQKATAIGMADTTFTDPSGLDDGNISTLHDLLRLAQYIYNNRSFIFKLTADQYTTTAYAADEFGELRNFNRFADLEDFYGGKVGETLAAGATSLTLHHMTVDGVERMVVIMVLGSEDRTADALRLHSYFQERFTN
jgi:D-alanyl-D-alanine carboxypeptidase